jgi:2-polyprenyl-3-methyl-5-hydroxy-6-metoxy-1,4-benzoquinol methylase
MLFDFIKDIVCDKKGDLLNQSDNHAFFNSFLIQRFLSFNSPNFCYILNSTINKKINLLDKKQVYNFLIAVTPKQTKYFSKYIKNEKNEQVFTENDKKVIDYLSKKNKISKKEVIEYIKILNLDIEKLSKGLN